MKYAPFSTANMNENDLFTYIYVDKNLKTAASYCEHRQCANPGKYQDLNYQASLIPTPFDWLQGVTSAEKIGEQQIDRRATWKVQTNKGVLWLDTYYGIPLQVEEGGNTYNYMEVNFNGNSEADVTPSG